MKASYVLKIPTDLAGYVAFPEIAILGIRGTEYGMVQVSPYTPPKRDSNHSYYHIHLMTMSGTLFKGGLIEDHATISFPAELQAIIDLPRWKLDHWLAQARSRCALAEAASFLAPLRHPYATVNGCPL